MRRMLFRYRSFNTEKLNDYSYIHQRIINIEKWKFEAFEGLVYPSSPLYFNDPYDCEFCFQSDALEGVLDRETYIHLLERRFSLKQEEKNRILYSDNIERAMQIVLQAHGGRLSDSWMNILQNGLNDCMSTIKDAVRVVCLSEVYDSMLMWSHYAQNHTGFCIEYDFKESVMLYKHSQEFAQKISGRCQGYRSGGHERKVVSLRAQRKNKDRRRRAQRRQKYRGQRQRQNQNEKMRII